jgi:hypothetical protein
VIGGTTGEQEGSSNDLRVEIGDGRVLSLRKRNILMACAFDNGKWDKVGGHYRQQVSNVTMDEKCSTDLLVTSCVMMIMMIRRNRWESTSLPPLHIAVGVV